MSIEQAVVALLALLALGVGAYLVGCQHERGRQADRRADAEHEGADAAVEAAGHAIDELDAKGLRRHRRAAVARLRARLDAIDRENDR